MQVQEEYEDALKVFGKRVVEELGDRVEAIISYGSVARGTASEDSDIDVLVIGKEGDWKKVSDIAYDIDLKRGFRTLITVVFYTREEMEERVRAGSPFAYDVLREGVVVYDSGTTKGLRKKVLEAGGRVP